MEVRGVVIDLEEEGLSANFEAPKVMFPMRIITPVEGVNDLTASRTFAFLSCGKASTPDVSMTCPPVKATWRPLSVWAFAMATTMLEGVL